MSLLINRHRKVIDQEGRSLEDTFVGKLRFAVGLAPRETASETTVQLPVALTAPTRTLPVVGHGVMELRVPVVPQAPTQVIRPSAWVRFGFARSARELNEFVAVISSGWRKAAAENDAAARRLDERLERLGARVHGWLGEGQGRDLAAAYAEGGTEKLLRLTPAVLAEMDALSKSGAHQVLAPAGQQVSA